jgi:hypothetical protein
LGAHMRFTGLFRGIFHRNNDVSMTKVTCPACSLVTNVENAPEIGAPRTYKCKCGCIIDSEIGFYKKPASLSISQVPH